MKENPPETQVNIRRKNYFMFTLSSLQYRSHLNNLKNNENA